MTDIDKILNIRMPCFACQYSHSCKYYGSSLWDQYIINHPDEGCPALKYDFNSIYIVAQNELELKKQNKYGGSKPWL